MAKPSGVDVSTFCRQLAWAMQQIATFIGGAAGGCYTSSIIYCKVYTDLQGARRLPGVPESWIGAELQPLHTCHVAPLWRKGA